MGQKDVRGRVDGSAVTLGREGKSCRREVESLEHDLAHLGRRVEELEGKLSRGQGLLRTDLEDREEEGASVPDGGVLLLRGLGVMGGEGNVGDVLDRQDEPEGEQVVAELVPDGEGSGGGGLGDEFEVDLEVEAGGVGDLESALFLERNLGALPDGAGVFGGAVVVLNASELGGNEGRHGLVNFEVELGWWTSFWAFAG